MNNLSRRRFLQSLSVAGAVTAGGGALFACSGGPTVNEGPLAVAGARGANDAHVVADPQLAGRKAPGAVDGRVLVIVDLQGGNDGLSTLVPAGDPRYYDMRPTLAVDEAEVLTLDDDVGFHPSLARLHKRGITTVEGVGPIDGDLPPLRNDGTMGARRRYGRKQSPDRLPRQADRHLGRRVAAGWRFDGRSNGAPHYQSGSDHGAQRQQ